MSEAEPIVLFGARKGYSESRKKSNKSSNSSGQNVTGQSVVRSFSRQVKNTPATTAFNRHELNTILSVYARRVADGEWRDYAIYHGKDSAVFSIFRRTSEVALYRVEKQPKLARKQGAYSVVTATGMVLRRGQDLAQVLKIIDRRPRLVPA
ncbi:MAG: DUF2794 domain-containing protein [Hyphomicrobiales bacterium]